MSSAQERAAGYEADAPPARGAGAAGAHRETAGNPEAGYQRGAGAEPGGYLSDTGAAQTGFTVLAAALMILSGLWSFFEGLTAIVKRQFFVSVPNYTFHFNLHGWGWVHLVLGIVIFAAGVCVLLGQTWARAVGIILAVISGIANFIFLPYYPIWSIAVMAIDVFIIWALATGIGRRTAA